MRNKAANEPSPAPLAQSGDDDDGVNEILSSCVALTSNAPPPVTSDEPEAPSVKVPRAPALPSAVRIQTQAISVPPSAPASSTAPVATSQPQPQPPEPPTDRPTMGRPLQLAAAALGAVAITVVVAWSRDDRPQPNEATPRVKAAAPAPDLAAQTEPAMASTAAPAMARAAEPAADPGKAPVAAATPPLAAASASAELGSDDDPDPEAARSSNEASFDREAAARALSAAAVRARRCASPAEPQVALMSVTFMPSGEVERVYLLGGPYTGQPPAWCMVRAFGGIQVAPFSGDPVTLHKGIHLRPKAPAAPAE